MQTTESAIGGTTTESPAGGTTTQRAVRPTTDATSTADVERTTDTAGDAAAIEFLHRRPAFGRGVSDISGWYYGRILSDEREADRLDPSSARGVAGQDPEAVRRFVAETDFDTAAILAVQAEVDSSARGLEFAFVNRAVSPPRVVAFVGDRDRPDSKPGISTLLVRVPTEVASRLSVTVLESDFAFEGRVRSVVTFSPRRDVRFESVRVRGRDRAGDPLPDPGGALITGAAAAEEFAPREAVFAEFVRGTDFDRSYLLAVRSSFDALDYVWPQSVVRDGNRVVADVRRYDLRMGMNPVYSSLTLTRIPASSPPVGGTAVVRRYPERRPNTPAEAELVALSADPEEWRTTGRTTTGQTTTDK